MANPVKENTRPTTATGGSGSASEISDGTSNGNATVLATRDANPAAGDNPLVVRAILGDELAIADLLAFAADGYVPTDIVPGARNALLTAALLAGPMDGTNTAIRLASVLDGYVANPNPNDNPLLVRAILGDEERIGDFIEFATYTPADVSPGTTNPLFSVSLLCGPRSGASGAFRPATVLDGIGSAPAADDNPLLVQQVGPAATAVNAGAESNITTATATDIVAANADRRYVEIQNRESAGGETLYLKLGSDAGAADGYPLEPGEVFYLAHPAIFTGRISGYHAKGGDLTVAVIEF